MEIPEGVANEIASYAERSSPWMKFLGVLSIISGIIAAFTIVGIVIAWLPIWMGVLLFQAGSFAKKAKEENKGEHLAGMMKKLKTFFLIDTITVIISIVFALIAIALGILGGLGGMRGFGG
ncbi:hypothetical protein DRP53_03005 [candidate division WOR-3 bacterium]|uniref:DUF5362 domain-containing protein n=1 Tax=candidate division WOR-3 bacterium TaxID=2052148 RepID=A0A660SJP4_UNCW3|nr:MAG: hypothetical protein DRP53_03005 [candidate division WOR-3 bacterium]